MKTLKKIIVALVVLVGIYVIVSFFAPDSYEVKRVKTINAPVEVVWEQVSKFNNWESWSPWKEKDPTVTFTLDGADGTVGTTYKWTGDVELSGEGYMKITEVVEHEKFSYDLGFIKPWEMESKGAFTLSGNGESTDITWTDRGDIGFMGRVPMMFMSLDDMIGPDFERGLFKIDSLSMLIAEAQKADQVKEEMFAGGIYLGKRQMIQIAELDSSIYADGYAALGMFCGQNGVEMTGAPSSIFYDWNEETDSTDMAVVFKIGADVDVADSGLELTKIPETKALVYDYYGPYEDGGKGHEKLMEYMSAKGYEMTICVEEFLNDPTTVNSPDEILTRIYYLLK